MTRGRASGERQTPPSSGQRVEAERLETGAGAGKRSRSSSVVSSYSLDSIEAEEGRDSQAEDWEESPEMGEPSRKRKRGNPVVKPEHSRARRKLELDANTEFSWASSADIMATILEEVAAVDKVNRGAGSLKGGHKGILNKAAARIAAAAGQLAARQGAAGDAGSAQAVISVLRSQVAELQSSNRALAEELRNLREELRDGEERRKGSRRVSPTPSPPPSPMRTRGADQRLLPLPTVQHMDVDEGAAREAAKARAELAVEEWPEARRPPLGGVSKRLDGGLAPSGAPATPLSQEDMAQRVAERAAELLRSQGWSQPPPAQNPPPPTASATAESRKKGRRKRGGKRKEKTVEGGNPPAGGKNPSRPAGPSTGGEKGGRGAPGSEAGEPQAPRPPTAAPPTTEPTAAKAVLWTEVLGRKK